MNPLVVRPEPQNQALCRALAEAGHRPLACPLLSFGDGAGLHALPALFDTLTHRDYVIAVSVPAVTFTDNALRRRGLAWPPANYVAVGDATGRALAGAGITGATVPEDPRSEGIVSLPGLQALDGCRVLILRGDGGRHMIAPALARRGARVDYCEVYRRHYRADPGGSLVKSWQSAGVDSIIVTSGGLLAHVFQLATAHAKDWLLSRLLIVPSIRVADSARELGFTQVINAEGASNQALIAALDERKRNDRQ
ncbi:uroporphyrinogen-III synthase [Zobellella iuensis]|uniref:Uroporphyrinogen-III synthase n=1 Tax=Zobellella iuensis TaxID=2803811 RepID=A0ABS1QLI3_9GAMM|nr:uroporphyrinogen-III synthase [Zobellella iuensis]MBL1375733.1 uroporphyrinogen-III synthase [Zobellella iuensis]